MSTSQTFRLGHDLIFPVLHVRPGGARGGLERHFRIGVPTVIAVNSRALLGRHIDSVAFGNVVAIRDSFNCVHGQGRMRGTVRLAQALCPSPGGSCCYRRCSFAGTKRRPIAVHIPR